MTLYDEAVDHAVEFADEASDCAHNNVGLHYASVAQAWALIALAVKDTDRGAEVRHE